MYTTCNRTQLKKSPKEVVVQSIKLKIRPKIIAKIRIAIPMSNISSNIGDPFFPLILKQLILFKNISIVLSLYPNLVIKTPQNKFFGTNTTFHFPYSICEQTFFSEDSLKKT